MTLDEAIDGHLQCTLYTSSFGDPREIVEHGPLRIIRDAPGRKRDPRKETMVVSGVDPDQAMAAVRDYGPRHWALSVIEPTDADHDALKAAYKAGGYRLIIRFPLFAKNLERAIDVPHRFAIERVVDPILIEAVARAKGQKLNRDVLQPGDAPIRIYAAVADGKPFGWVTSIRATAKANWVSDLFVMEAHRGMRTGEQLLRSMLIEDQMYRVKNSVLLSSGAGVNLYSRLGYEQIGLMQLFTPVRGKLK